MRTLLNDLPPLESRPRKTVPQRHLSINKTEDEWDFQEQPSSNEENDASNNEIASDSRVQQQVKRHISFGDVVVKNPPQPYTNTSGGEQVMASETQCKKSRFTVDQSTAPSQDSPILQPKDTSINDDPSLRKTRLNINHQLVKQSSEQHSASSSIESTLSERHDHHGYSDRKSRFEVHHGDDTAASSSPQLPASVCPAPMPNSTHALCRHSSQPSSGYALARESSSSRKVGRFELTSTTTDSSKYIT